MTEETQDIETPEAGAGTDSQGEDNAQPWYGELNDDHKGYIEKNGYKDMGALIQSAQHAEKLLGMKDRTGLMVKPVGTRADNPDAWKEFDAMAGIPDAAKDYPDVPKIEGLDLQDGIGEKLKDIAKAANVPGDSFPAFLEGALGLLKDSGMDLQAGASGELEKMGAALQKEWGTDYDQNVASAQGAVRAIMAEAGNDDFVDFLNESKIGDDPRFIKAMNIAARRMAEGGGLPGEGNNRQDVGNTVAALEEKYARHSKDYKDAIYDRGNTEHSWAVKHREDLAKQIEVAKKR